MEKIKGMKSFKDYQTFVKKVEKSICWEDYFLMDGKTYKIYEYGGGSMMHMDFDYVYFYNKKSKTMIYIKYDCPSYKYVEGVKIVTKEYRFISIEVMEDPFLWRTDTL